MSPRLIDPRLVFIGLLAAASLLAGCGKMADLERPRPMFGTPSDAAPETDARHAAAQRARADARAVSARDAPQSIEELRTYTLPNGKLSEQPIQAVPGAPDASQPDQTPSPSSTTSTPQ